MTGERSGLYQSPKDARRFLLGFAIALIGLGFILATAARGVHHVEDTFWLSEGGLLLGLIGGFIGHGPLNRAYNMYYRREQERPINERDRYPVWGATKSIYSRAGFREAFHTAFGGSS